MYRGHWVSEGCVGVGVGVCLGVWVGEWALNKWHSSYVNTCYNHEYSLLYWIWPKSRLSEFWKSTLQFYSMWAAYKFISTVNWNYYIHTNSCSTTIILYVDTCQCNECWLWVKVVLLLFCQKTWWGGIKKKKILKGGSKIVILRSNAPAFSIPSPKYLWTPP